MVSTVTARPNLYQELGLTPAASASDIEQAFAREVSPFRPRPVGGVARVSIAYETLRDPARRRAYDASLGLTGDGQGAAAAAAEPPQFVAAPEAPPAPCRAPDAEPRLGSFFATALREGRPEPEIAPAAVAAAPPVTEADDERIAWQRPALIAAGLVAAVGLAGAMAGVSLGADVEASQQAAAVTLALPQAQAVQPPALPVEAPAVVRVAADARPFRTAQPARVTSAPPAVEPETLAEEADAGGAGQATAQSSAVTPQEPALVTTAAATLPLSNRLIAQTIRRIGYACGEVASVSPGEGGAGVFTVACTSGDSYRAAPVRGRYHFRRLGRH